MKWVTGDAPGAGCSGLRPAGRRVAPGGPCLPPLLLSFPVRASGRHVLVPRGVSLSGVVAHGPHIRAFAGLPELSRGAGVAGTDLACGGPALTLTPALPCVEVADRSSWEREGSRRAADFRGGVRWHVLAQNSGLFLTYFVKHFLPEYLILLTNLTPHSPKLWCRFCQQSGSSQTVSQALSEEAIFGGPWP